MTAYPPEAYTEAEMEEARAERDQEPDDQHSGPEDRWADPEWVSGKAMLDYLRGDPWPAPELEAGG
jgi:hypothetical protein